MDILKEMNSLNDPIRSKSVNKINKVIDDMYKSLIIEKSVYNYCIDYTSKNNISRNWDNRLFKSLYINKLISVYSNIDASSYIENKYLIGLINSEDFDLENIANMSRYDIFPDRWKHLIEDKLRKDKILSEMKPHAMTDQVQCNKWKSRKCSYYAMQTRSADEPMTMFMTCLNCNSRWKS